MATYEEIYGVDKAREIKQKLKTCYKGKGMLGRNHSKETKKKISLSKNGVSMTPKHKENVRLAALGRIHPRDSVKRRVKKFIGYKHTKEARKKISLAKKGGTVVHSNKTKEKIRKSTIKRIERQMNNGQPLTPNIGRNEMYILDAIEIDFKTVLTRQYRVCGYFVDGYDEKNNIVYEVYEDFHYSNLIKIGKDKLRKRNIVKELKP